MITDWSGAGQDYGLGLGKPVICVDLPFKARNDAWRELGIEPFESWVRDKLGVLIAPDALERLPGLVRELARDPGRSRDLAAKLREDWVYNIGRSGIAGAEAIAAIARELRP
jgi:hypothetical protein